MDLVKVRVLYFIKQYYLGIKPRYTLYDLLLGKRGLSECICSISEFLDGARIGINEYLDNKYEMLANSDF